MKRDRNFEGYRDLTTVRYLPKFGKWWRKEANWNCLTYTLEEARGFRQVVNNMRKQERKSAE